MSSREDYTPGAANMATVQKDGEEWILVLVKQLSHSPEMVWQALTAPAELREWAPFDADTNLGIQGAKVTLTTVGAPKPHVTETTILVADAPKLLQYKWGDSDVRWELEPMDRGTKLTLWTKIDRRFISMGAAGWHLCLDVLEHLLDGTHIGRIVAGDALQFEGWQRLNREYAEQFGVEAPKW